jgi:hypothetical protein
MDLGDIWNGWSDDERALFDDAIETIGGDLGQTIANDDWAGFLYHEAMWDFDIPADYRAGAYDAFIDYMLDTYDVEWDEVYDWEAYREAYDAA